MVMVEGILVGLLGSTAYETLKKLVNKVFGEIHEDDLLINKTYEAVERACQRFFKKYKKEFGPPGDSFLAREENHEILIRCIYLDSKELTIKDLNPDGFRNAPKATDEALKFLVKVFEEELKKDRELVKEMETIKHLRQTEDLVSLIKTRDIKDQKVSQLLTQLPPRKIRLIGRKEDLKKLEQRLKETDRVLLVDGMAGIGKTEVCKRYFMENYKKFSFAGWFDFVSSIKVSLVNGIDWDSQTAKLYMAKNEKDTPDILFRKILSFFMNLEKNALWVVDNIEDAGDEDLDTLMALPPHVKVIVTSRKYIEGCERHCLDFLSAGDCKALFYEFYEVEKDDAGVEKIVDLCGRHTLTVELLAKTAEVASMSVKDFYGILKEKGFNLNKVINYRVGTSCRNEKEKKTFFNHMLKIFDISCVTKSELHLLINLAVLPAVYIPVYDFSKWMNMKCQEDIDCLVRKGWLRKDGSKIFMHQVIQEVIRYRTKPDVKECKKLILSLAKKLYWEAEENPLDKKDFVIFGESVLRYIDDNNQIIATLSNNLAEIIYPLGQMEKALKFQLKAVRIREEVLDENHPDLAVSYNNLDVIYSGLGKLEKALEFQLKAVKIKENTLDKNNPSLANSYNNLSVIYRKMNRPEQALKIQFKALKVWGNVSDKEHPHLAASYNNLSLIYLALGQFEEALEIQLKALKIREKKLDKNHPDLATSYNSLSLIYQALGQSEKALKIQLKALKIREKVLDNNHLSLAESYNNLAVIYLHLKDYESASKYGEKAVAILQGLFPQGHPDLDEYKQNLEKIERKRVVE